MSIYDDLRTSLETAAAALAGITPSTTQETLDLATASAQVATALEGLPDETESRIAAEAEARATVLRAYTNNDLSLLDDLDLQGIVSDALEVIALRAQVTKLKEA